MTAPPLDAPPGVHMEERGDAEARELVLVVPWFQWFGVFALLCAIVMALPAAIFWIGGEEPGIALMLSLPPLGALYWSLAVLFNKTTITWSARWLTVKHGPLPWPHGFEAAVDRIDRVTVLPIRRVRRGRVVATRHDAVAIVAGVSHRLVPGVSDRDRLHFVAETLGDALAKGRGRAQGATPP